MTAYYNEIDPFAAEWLRNLILFGLIADGVVDTRSISEVHPNDLREFDQCHFFAGIGVWSHALRLARWPDERPVWTGSCPCQPFSSAGRGLGTSDERHLWPHFHHLIRECRPTTVFGEQVASKDGLAWLDLVSTDLEGEGYTFGASDMCAAGIGAPHIRQRLYWVADSDHQRSVWKHSLLQRSEPRRFQTDCSETTGCGKTSILGDSGCERLERLGQPEYVDVSQGRSDSQRFSPEAIAPGNVNRTNGYWRDADWLTCRDGKWRSVEPGTFPLAHGAPARVGRLRAYGNAIVPQVAQTFVTAFMEYESAKRA